MFTKNINLIFIFHGQTKGLFVVLDNTVEEPSFFWGGRYVFKVHFTSLARKIRETYLPLFEPPDVSNQFPFP